MSSFLSTLRGETNNLPVRLRCAVRLYEEAEDGSWLIPERFSGHERFYCRIDRPQDKPHAGHDYDFDEVAIASEKSLTQNRSMMKANWPLDGGLKLTCLASPL